MSSENVNTENVNTDVLEAISNLSNSFAVNLQRLEERFKPLEEKFKDIPSTSRVSLICYLK